MDQTRIWDYMQTDEEMMFWHALSLPRLRFIAEKIKSGESVLNIGVGCGNLERILLKKGCRVSALDPSGKSIDNLRDSMDLGEHAKVGYAQDIPFGDNTFDCVVMSEVLEHLSAEAITATMKEVGRALKPGGRLIGTVPADEDLKLNMVVCPSCGEIFHRWGHMQSFTHERLNALLTTTFHGIHISRQYFFCWNKMDWKGTILSLLKLAFLKVGIIGSGTTLFFEVYK